jgi:hypothetical protein
VKSRDGKPCGVSLVRTITGKENDKRTGERNCFFIYRRSVDKRRCFLGIEGQIDTSFEVDKRGIWELGGPYSGAL